MQRRWWFVAAFAGLLVVQLLALPQVNASFQGATNAAASWSTAASFYRATVMADSPVGYWRLNEAPGSSTTANELGGVPGTLVGAVTLGAPGYSRDSSTALSVPGTNSSVVRLGDAYQFDGQAPFSAEFWWRTTDTSTTNYRRLLSSEETIDGKREGWDIYKADSYLSGSTYYAWLCYERYHTDTYSGNCAGPYSIGAWHHTVGTYDGATMRLYVDGQLQFSAASTLSLSARSTGLVLGARADSLFNTYFGVMDEVAVYNYPLSLAQIQTHYARGG